jgi:lysozyme family protein
MRDNFPASLKEVLRHEGGYVNHPSDAGGATNKGITQAVYDGYRRSRGLLPRSVKMITDSEVADCYRVNYWDKICGDALPKGIDFLTFDAAVNSGTARGEKWLQQAINRVAQVRRLKEDGQIGLATIDASDDYPAAAIIDAYIDLRLGFMKVAKNTKTGQLLWPIFGRGWGNRLLGEPDAKGVRQANGVIQVAKRMAGTVPAPTKIPLPPEATVRPSPGLFAGLLDWLRPAAAATALYALIIVSGGPAWPLS